MLSANDSTLSFPKLGFNISLLAIKSFEDLDTISLDKKPYLIKDEKGLKKVWWPEKNVWKLTLIGNIETPPEWASAWELNQTVFVSPKNRIFDTLEIIQAQSIQVITNKTQEEIIEIFCKLPLDTNVTVLFHQEVIKHSDNDPLFGQDFWQREFKKQFPSYYDPHENVDNWFNKFREYYKRRENKTLPLPPTAFNLILEHAPLSLADIPAATRVNKQNNENLTTHQSFWEKKYQHYFPKDYYQKKFALKTDQNNKKNAFKKKIENGNEFPDLSPEQRQHLIMLSTLPNNGEVAKEEKAKFNLPQKVYDDFANKLTALEQESLNWKKEFKKQFDIEYAFPGLLGREKRHLRALLILVNDGDLAGFEKLTFQDLPPKLLKMKNNSALDLIHIAANQAQKTQTVASQKILQMLLDSLIYYDDPTALRSCILYNASLETIGHLATINTIRAIERRDQKYTEDWGPLQNAAYANRPDVISLLIKHGANKNFSNPSVIASTALLVAVSYNNLQAVEVLLKHGVNTGIKVTIQHSHPFPNPRFGELPIHIAAKRGYEKILSALLTTEIAPSIDEPDADGTTALLLAVKNDHVKTAKLLIERGAKLSIPLKVDHDKATRGDTALHLAAKSGNIHMVKMLLGYSISITPTEILPPKTIFLSLAEDDIYFETTETKNGQKITDQLGPHAEAIKTVLRNRKTQQLNLEQLAAVYKATSAQGYRSCLNENDNPINMQGHLKSTPLHDAVSYGHTEVVKILLHHQADINARNQLGQSALELALLNKNDNMAQLLFQNGADVKFKTSIPSSEYNANILFPICVLISDIEKFSLDAGETARNQCIRRLQDKIKNARLTYDGNNEKSKQLFNDMEKDHLFISQIDDFIHSQSAWLKLDADHKNYPGRDEAIKYINECVEKAYRKEISFISLVRQVKALHHLDLIADDLLTSTDYMKRLSKDEELPKLLRQEIKTAYGLYCTNPHDLSQVNEPIESLNFKLIAILKKIEKDHVQFRNSSRGNHSAETIREKEHIKKLLTALFNPKPLEMFIAIKQIIELIEKTNSLTETNKPIGRKKRVIELRQKAYLLGENYNDIPWDVKENKIKELTSELKQFKLLDNYANEFAQSATGTQTDFPAKEKALAHLRGLIEKTYQGEISFDNLQNAIHAFRTLELIIQALSAITYRGGNDQDHLANMRIILTLIEHAYTSYVKSTTDFQSLNISIINQANDVFDSIKQTHQTKYSRHNRHLWLFKSRETDPNEDLVLQVNQAQSKLQNLKL